MSLSVAAAADVKPTPTGTTNAPTIEEKFFPWHAGVPNQGKYAPAKKFDYGAASQGQQRIKSAVFHNYSNAVDEPSVEQPFHSPRMAAYMQALGMDAVAWEPPKNGPLQALTIWQGPVFR